MFCLFHAQQKSICCKHSELHSLNYAEILVNRDHLISRLHRPLRHIFRPNNLLQNKFYIDIFIFFFMEQSSMHFSYKFFYPDLNISNIDYRYNEMNEIHIFCFSIIFFVCFCSCFFFLEWYRPKNLHSISALNRL